MFSWIPTAQRVFLVRECTSTYVLTAACCSANLLVGATNNCLLCFERIKICTYCCIVVLQPTAQYVRYLLLLLSAASICCCCCCCCCAVTSCWMANIAAGSLHRCVLSLDSKHAYIYFNAPIGSIPGTYYSVALTAPFSLQLYILDHYGHERSRRQASARRSEAPNLRSIMM